MNIPKLYRKQNPLGYLLWKMICQKSGYLTSLLEKSFWGHSRGLNEYNEIADYKKSHTKPDKQYSILPTVIKIAGSVAGKVIIDLGCGTGFFTIPFAEKAKKVFGLDNSETQIGLAKQHPRVTYLLRDIFSDPIPKGDIIVAPFVLNYANNLSVLEFFIENTYKSLSDDGKLVLVIDLPNNQNLQRFGAKKKIVGEAVDESEIEITLFSRGLKVCVLQAVYYTKQSVERALRKAGFRDITWHTPIISDEGVRDMGQNFWDGYTTNPELGYLTARKTTH